MSTQTFNNNTSCAFCRANKKSWNHPLNNSDGQVVCVELLNYKCPYCKEKGHTTKHCPVLADKEQQRRAKWERNQVTKQQQVSNLQHPAPNLQHPAPNLQQPPANSWAAKAAAKITPEQQLKIDEDNLRFKRDAEQKQAEKAEKDRLAAQEAKALAKANWERWYLRAMPAQFGLKEAYGPYPVGSFWEFFIEGKQFQGKSADTDMAKALRENPENKTKFRQYLATKYYRWLDETEDTPDDCAYLWRLREEEIRQEEDAYYYTLERERAELLHLDQERQEMDRQLAAHEITHEQYRDWDLEREEDLNDCLEFSSLRYDRYLFDEASRRRQWKERKDAIEKL
jgi:hypothetical protein